MPSPDIKIQFVDGAGPLLAYAKVPLTLFNTERVIVELKVLAGIKGAGVKVKNGTDIAGDWIRIHHNTFKATKVRAVVIRGRPSQRAEIHHNWFLHTNLKNAVRQSNAVGNMHVYRNQFGANRILKE